MCYVGGSQNLCRVAAKKERLVIRDYPKQGAVSIERERRERERERARNRERERERESARNRERERERESGGGGARDSSAFVRRESKLTRPFHFRTTIWRYPHPLSKRASSCINRLLCYIFLLLNFEA